MKKNIVILLVGCFLLVGCNNKEEVYKELLQEYAETYYNNYMSGVDNQNRAEITLKMLKVSNEYNGEFDLSKLDKCADETTVILNLDANKKIIDYEFELKCN